MRSKIRQLIRWARVSRDGDDAGDYPVQQVEYLGKTADAAVWFPYGMHANIPAVQTGELESLALMFSVAANAEARVIIPGSPQTRPRLAAGEVVYFHPPTGSKVHFKANGDVDVVTDADVNVDSEGTVTVDGATKVEILSAGDVDVTTSAGDVNVTATLGDLNATAAAGDVNVTATLGAINATAAAGAINATATVGDITLTAVAGIVNLGAAGGLGVARIGDSIGGGVISTGSAKVFST